jgi:guanine deaminase
MTIYAGTIVDTPSDPFDGARHYLDTYRKHGLVTKRSVFAHNVHPSEAELAVLAEHGASVAHCPTSNCALGSGLFLVRRRGRPEPIRDLLI